MKRYAILYLPIAVLVALVTFVVGWTLTRYEIGKLKDQESNFLVSSMDILKSSLDFPFQHLRGLIREPAINRALQSPLDEARSLMEEHLQTLMYRNPFYDQARWLSASGMELVRVNYTENNPEIVQQSELQDKSSRYYYKEAILLKPGQIYMSPLDLNIENDIVEVPYKPMIRLAIRLPVVDGLDQGLLVINFRAQVLIDHLRLNVISDHAQHPMLLNPAGYWLMAPNPDDAWGFMFGREITLAERHPSEWAVIAAESKGQLMTGSGLWNWITIDPEAQHPDIVKAAERWKLATHVSTAEIAYIQWRQWRPLIVLSSLSLVLLAIGVFFYCRLLLEKEDAESELTILFEKRSAEDRLIVSVERLRLAMDAARMGSYHWDIPTGEIVWSDMYRRIFGLPPDSPASYDNWLASLLPDDREATEQAVRSAMENRSDYDTEYRIRKPDGAVCWISAKGRFFYDAGGSPLRMEGVLSDITEHKQTEAEIRNLNVDLEQKVDERTAELRRSEAFVKTTLDTLPANICVLDITGTIVMVNRKWREFADANPPAPENYGVGTNYLAVCAAAGEDPSGDAHLFAEGLRSVLAGDRTSYEQEYPCHSPTEQRWFNAQVTRFVGSHPALVVITHENITERKQYDRELHAAKEAADAANVAKSEFLSNMSHEIRTPMNSIMGMAQLLARTELNDEQSEFVAIIRKSSESLLSLINDILDLSKIEAGKIELEPGRFSLRGSIGDVVKTQISLIHGKGLGIQIDIPDDVPDSLYGDPLRFKQVLLNLLSNAIKFTERGDIRIAVAVNWRRNNDIRLEITVADRGIGISPESMLKIFEPFVQADASTTRKYGGTGLGLSICTRLTELMGGKVWAESREGSGSTFHVQLPFVVDDTHVIEPNRVGGDTVIPSWDGPLLRILLVDDQETNRYFVARLLRKTGHTVIEARNGREALQQWEQEPCDVILMDIQMPVMNGIEVTQAIRCREKESGGHVPIVAVTARALQEERKTILSQGFDGYLPKPIDVGALFREIQRCLPEHFPRSKVERLSQTQPIAEITPAIDREALLPLLNDIEYLLKKRNMAASDKVNELVKAVPASAAVDRLRHHVRRFDFEGAMACLPDIYRAFDLTP